MAFTNNFIYQTGTGTTQTIKAGASQISIRLRNSITDATLTIYDTNGTYIVNIFGGYGLLNYELPVVPGQQYPKIDVFSAGNVIIDTVY